MTGVGASHRIIVDSAPDLRGEDAFQKLGESIDKAKRATKMPAAKGRPKRSSSWGTSHKEEDQDAMPLWIDGQGAAPLWLEDQGAMPLWVPDETFCEEMSEWFDSPEGELWTDMSDTLEGSAERRAPRCRATHIPLA